jgi:hypothetical protein
MNYSVHYSEYERLASSLGHNPDPMLAIPGLQQGGGLADGAHALSAMAAASQQLVATRQHSGGPPGRPAGGRGGPGTGERKRMLPMPSEEALDGEDGGGAPRQPQGGRGGGRGVKRERLSGPPAADATPEGAAPSGSSLAATSMSDMPSEVRVDRPDARYALVVRCYLSAPW